MSIINKRLKAARIVSNLTLKELSDISNIHMNLIHRYENGANIGLIKAAKLCVAMDVSLDFIGFGYLKTSNDIAAHHYLKVNDKCVCWGDITKCVGCPQ